MAGEYYSGIRKTRKRGDLWETIGEERKTRRVAVEHSRGEGTEMRVEQAWIKQPVVKGSLNPVRIKKILAVPALAFSTAALLASVPGCCLPAVSFAKLAWLESEEMTSVGHTLPLTVGCPSPWHGMLWGRRTGCGSWDSHPLLSSRLNLKKLFSQLE